MILRGGLGQLVPVGIGGFVDAAGFAPTAEQGVDAGGRDGLVLARTETDEIGGGEVLGQEGEQRGGCTAFAAKGLQGAGEFALHLFAPKFHLVAEDVLGDPLCKGCDSLGELAVLEQIAEHTCTEAHDGGTTAERIHGVGVGIDGLLAFILQPIGNSGVELRTGNEYCTLPRISRAQT